MTDTPWEVVTIDGVVQKEDGSDFTRPEAEQFIDSFLEWCTAQGLGFGGSIAPEWPEQITLPAPPAPCQ